MEIDFTGMTGPEAFRAALGISSSRLPMMTDQRLFPLRNSPAPDILVIQSPGNRDASTARAGEASFQEPGTVY